MTTFTNPMVWVQKMSIIDEWKRVEVPQPPELREVSVNPGKTSLLILDIQYGNCNSENRPRCVATLPNLRALAQKCRDGRLKIIYSTTRSSDRSDIRSELAPQQEDEVVSSGVDKFHGTDLESMLNARNIDTVIIVGTSAHGAVLHTATAAAIRGLRVIVPVDCLSASDAYAEQYTTWHLANAPGSRRNTLLTRSDLIRFR